MIESLGREEEDGSLYIWEGYWGLDGLLESVGDGSDPVCDIQE